MAHITFNTLKFLEKLMAAGIPDQQAKAITEAQSEAFNEALDNTLATKADLVRVEMHLKQEINSLKQDVIMVKGDFHLLKWMMGFLLAGVASLIVKNFF